MGDRGAHGPLLDGLDEVRRHVLGSLGGLSPEQLHRPVLPSGWSPLGLISHLTVDVERLWFGAVVGADPATIAGFEQRRDAWRVDPQMPPDGIIEQYREECARSDEVLARCAFDASPRWWPHHFGDWRLDSVGEVVVHVVVETACHAGHLDVARELVDGRQWMVLS